MLVVSKCIYESENKIIDNFSYLRVARNQLRTGDEFSKDTSSEGLMYSLSTSNSLNMIEFPVILLSITLTFLCLENQAKSASKFTNSDKSDIEPLTSKNLYSCSKVI